MNQSYRMLTSAVGGIILWTCEGCGAVVSDMAAHDRAHQQAGRQALLDAADWFEQDEDDGGPSYHLDGHAWYDGTPWVAAQLRARAQEAP